MEALRCDAVLPRARVYPSLGTQTQRSIIGVGVECLKNFFAKRNNATFRAHLVRGGAGRSLGAATAARGAILPAIAIPLDIFPSRVTVFNVPNFFSFEETPDQDLMSIRGGSTTRSPRRKNALQAPID